MVLLALPPADHLPIERDRGQFVPSRRRRMMANVRAERLLKIPAEPNPELRITGAAAQTRVVSVAGIRLRPWESAQAFKGIICDDISEFESHMPSHAVGSLWRVYPVHGLCEQRHSANAMSRSQIDRLTRRIEVLQAQRKPPEQRIFTVLVRNHMWTDEEIAPTTTK